jgi:hypothetical protein
MFMFRRSLRTAALGVVLLTLGARAQAPEDVRVALVIGNAAYAGSAALANPVNDARAMAETLSRFGFQVVEVRDADRSKMLAAIDTLHAKLKGHHGVGMLYYAGHGLQLDWQNYMVPVDARLATSSDVPKQAVSVNAVMEAFKQADSRVNIVVLDACRDNPFTDKASAKGLAQMDAPPGTFLAYATAPGNAAEDGRTDGANGLYTGFLLDELNKPSAKIEDVFKRVRFQVRKQSQGRQVPWESTSLEDDFYFNAGLKAGKPVHGAVNREEGFLKEKAEWDKIAQSKNPEDFYAFLLKYPSGNVSELAQSRLEQLAKATLSAQADRNGAVPQGLEGRYRDGDTYRVVIKDGLTGVVKGRPDIVIRQTGEDSFEGVINGQSNAETTSAGFVKRDVSGVYDPPYATVPGGEFQVGKKWSSRSNYRKPNGYKGWVDIDAKIAAKERITVPLGTVDTFRVEVNMVYENGWRVKNTFWLEPEWGVATKYVRELRRSANDAPDILVREVVSRQRPPLAAAQGTVK